MMDKFNLNDIQPFLFLAIGAGLVILSFLKKSTSSNLKLTGDKVEGIVFELDNTSYSSHQVSNTMDKVTIRFVTKNKEWITADLNQEFAIFYKGQYKIGDKVDVFYDPSNPSKFLIDTKQSELNGRILFAVIGTLFFLVGLYQIFTTS